MPQIVADLFVSDDKVIKPIKNRFWWGHPNDQRNIQGPIGTPFLPRGSITYRENYTVYRGQDKVW